MLKQRILAVMLVLLLLGQMGGTVFATDVPMSSAAAYYQEETLYAFARFPNYANPTELQVGLMVNDVQIGAEQTPEPLSTVEAPTEYLLLVDCSTSMPVYQDRILALGDALMAQQAAVTLATFGEAFEVVAEGLTDAQSLQNALNGLDFGQQGTDICGGVIYGIEYVKNHLWEPGKLGNLILVTDGVPFYSNNTATEIESETLAANALKAVLEESPQILLHSICFDQWEKKTYEAVASGIGYHLTPGNVESTAEAGDAIAALNGSLYRLSFPLETYSDDLSLNISNREFITVAPVRDLNEPADNGVIEELPIIVDVETAPEPTEAVEPSQEPTPTPEPSSEPTAEPEQEAVSPAPISAEETVVPETVVTEPESDEETIPSRLTLAVIAGAIGLLVVVLLVVLLLRRKKKADKASPVSVALRLEVLWGSVSSKKRQFVLSDSLFIGSDSRCDVILPDAEPLNARVFLQDGTVFIEDLNSPDGTILGGMRIYAPNILRSGEQIMIGQVCFSFSYEMLLKI